MALTVKVTVPAGAKAGDVLTVTVDDGRSRSAGKVQSVLDYVAANPMASLATVQAHFAAIPAEARPSPETVRTQYRAWHQTHAREASASSVTLAK